MDLIQKQRASVAEHIRLENEHAWAAVPTTLVQDDRAFYDLVSVGLFKGAEGVRQFYQKIGAAFPDLRIEISAEYDVPGCSIREGWLTATHQGEYLGIPPTGLPIRIAIAGFFVFDQTSGELLGERLYMDQGSALRQLQGKQTPR
jgi:predicted ester cyclase